MKKYIIDKVCMIGFPAVGKTSVVRKEVHDIFSDKYLQTIGTKVSSTVIKDVPLGDISCYADEKLLIWDLNSDKKFSSLMRAYYTGAEGALVTFDNTREKTLDEVGNLIHHLTAVVGKIVPMVFLANKVDLAEISQYKVRKIAEKFNAPYYYTSAKTGRNINKAFDDLAKLILENKEFNK